MLGLASTICDLGCVKSLIGLWLVVIGASLAHAEALKPADREALLDSIEKLHQTAQSNVDSRFLSALSAYREAMVSDETAIEFYLKCTEKLEFEDKDRKEADFREWKKKHDRKISADGFGLALRQQLRWLVLTMRSSSEKSDPETIADEAAEIVDSIFGNMELLRSQSEVLKQSASGTIFSRAYEIGSYIKSPLPQSPFDLEAIYENFILPPIRATGDTTALRGAWIKRIKQEGYRSGGGEQTREGPILKAPKSDAYERFVEEKLPELQWQMEVDLFRHGDEVDAAKRMCEHIEKHINHPSARKWSEALVRLIKPQEE
ncbi:MAG: hypothetical protein ACO3F7_01890 [Luteolibacter sp.]